jgi:hypothetical protein
MDLFNDIIVIKQHKYHIKMNMTIKKKQNYKVALSLILSLFAAYSAAVSLSALILAFTVIGASLKMWLLIDGLLSLYIVVVYGIGALPQIIISIIEGCCSKFRTAAEAREMEDAEFEKDRNNRDDVDDCKRSDDSGSAESPTSLLSHTSQHFEISQSMKEIQKGDEPYIRSTPHLLGTGNLSRPGGMPMHASATSALMHWCTALAHFLIGVRFIWTIIGTVALVKYTEPPEELNVGSIYRQSIVLGYIWFLGSLCRVGQR